ncbi:hypothetical protein LY90DRAFT_632436 [Neocallimastix californiae]|uniref:Uncharacterized protein n=1 Tax=Neocallimastix californiae TaxID=1754190 RepID=A0A1Y2AGV1_9FUNG|nr:hypothetical protein LY90DRAFT_632436 [Neocallimastix californiae]|eukprot:ORY21838.1 hypothetical protein LY90DRAFT_632436 [Neocallimastix californiae]
MINDVPTKTRVVTYHLVREKKVPFIVEINLDNNSFVKERKDKYTSNSINTFNSILIASYQKVNLEIFTPSSTVLMHIGTGNGGDLHKWKNFRKIVCVEPDHEKIKVLKERISKSEIRNRISILQNTIQIHIDSSSITYKQCIQTEINQFKDIIDKTSHIYLLSSLRYDHSECDNIMYINITDSYVINHYECAINSIRVKEIFVK